jgi:hypothetical protein
MTNNERNGGIDPAACERVVERIEHFERALQRAARNPSVEARDDLRDASDELMRAVAAIMIELGKQPSQP